LLPTAIAAARKAVRKITDACGSEYAMTLAPLKVVMAGLVPAIHARATTAGGADNRVDTRVEPAHDDLRLLVKIRNLLLVPGQPCGRAESRLLRVASIVCPRQQHR
jgi:hypothetical protein